MKSALPAVLLAAGALQLTLTEGRADVPTAEQDCRHRNAAVCETAGVEFVVEGPCPTSARTVRPPGTERCDAASVQRRQPSISRPPTTNEGSTKVSPARDNLARLGQIERWLLPTVLLAGGALACGFVAWRVLRWRRRRPAVKAAGDGGQSVLQVLVATAVALPVAWQAAGVAFQRVFMSFDNHDTAAPALLAAPVAVGVFVAVAVVAFAASAWVLRRLGNTLRAGR